MKAYWVSRVHITDPDEYAKYGALVGPAIAKFGGVLLARGGRQVILEGGDYERTVLIEFPSLEAAEACYKSPDYQHAHQFTINSSERLIVVVEGFDPGPAPQRAPHDEGMHTDELNASNDD